MSNLNEPQTFLAKYKLYKQATEYIAGWIAETAASTGFEVKTKEQKQPKSRSKKKNTGKKSKSGGGSTVYRIRVSDFVPMAEAIAKAGEVADSEIMVPVALCKHFSRAIQTRRKVSQWYKAKVHGDLQSDLRHEYFIGVLEDTFASLRPFLGSGGPAPARKAAPAARVPDLATRNRFAGLTVEELAALAEEEDIGEDTLPEISNVVLEEVEEDKEDDFWIAVALMLQEQHELREVVRENWEQYKTGQKDLAVAAMTTDTAIKIVQNAEAKFELLVTRPEKYPAAAFPVWTLPAVLFYNNHEDMHQWPLEETAKPSNRLGVTVYDQEEAHFDFWPVYAGLKFYLHKHITKKNSVPQVVPKDLGSDTHGRTLRAVEFAQVMRLIQRAPNLPPNLDMVSKGLMDMFDEHEIPMWLTYGVQLLFDTQDILGSDTKRPLFELQIYMNNIMAANKDLLDDWEDPIMPGGVQDMCYEQFRLAYNDMSPWANHDGFKGQWEKLKQDAKVAGHPTFKIVRSEEFYLYRHNPVLSGMLKYHFLLHWHAAGLSHEATGASLLFMAHVYAGTRLRYPNDRVWPDMEFVLFNQDPRYVLIKRPAENPEEARTLFDLATGQRTFNQIKSYDLSRLNFNKETLGLPSYDPNNKARLFRDASVFGDTVYLPNGASGHWITKKPGGAFSGRIDTIAKALLQAASPDSTRGRLARAMKASQEKHGLKLEPIAGREGLTSVAILQHFAFWLQADMADLCFDWSLMQYQCSETWKAIYAALERDPHWDRSHSQWGQSPQQAANRIITTSPIEGMYPRFMETAHKAMRAHISSKDESGGVYGEECLKSMIRDHKRTAALLTDDGPLSVEYLYKGWTREWQQKKREWLAEAVEEAKDPGASMKQLFVAQSLRAMSKQLAGALRF